MVPLNLKMIADFWDKMMKEQEAAQKINIKAMHKSDAKIPAATAAPSSATPTALTFRNIMSGT